MARMSIDDKVVRDPRIDRLARLCGWSRRETRACMEDVWALCYDRVVPYLPADDIEVAATRDAITPPMTSFVDAIKACGLARDATARDRFFEKKDGSKLPWPDGEWRDRVYLAGASERIGYLLTQKDAGHRGGLKSGESRRNQAEGSLKQPSSRASSDPQGSTNPSASASVPDPSSASAPSSASDNSEKNSARPSVGGSRSRSKPSEPTADERAIAMFVLSKLGQRSGVKFSGATEHIRLIVSRLRDGVTEHDLRKVIGYCAVELEWADDPSMAKYLRPETLFGPKTIAKYLDAARTWFDKQPGLQFDERPRLEVVQ